MSLNLSHLVRRLLRASGHIKSNYKQSVITHCLYAAQDFSGANMAMLASGNMAVFKQSMGILSMHYPEFTVKIFVVHPPVVMCAIWKVLQVHRSPCPRV